MHQILNVVLVANLQAVSILPPPLKLLRAKLEPATNSGDQRDGGRSVSWGGERFRRYTCPFDDLARNDVDRSGLRNARDFTCLRINRVQNCLATVLGPRPL